MSLSIQNSFIEFCKKSKFEINKKQVEIVKSLEQFLFPENKLISFFFKKEKRCFYLYGNVGVGKTMIAHYVYDQLNIKKMKVHFNEFMIAFHDFKHKRKDGYSITQFVQNLKIHCKITKKSMTIFVLTV